MPPRNAMHHSFVDGDDPLVRVAAVGPDAHGRQLKARDVRVPQTMEADVLAIFTMYAGDAGELAKSGAMFAGDGARRRFALARPGDDAACVVSFHISFGQRG